MKHGRLFILMIAMVFVAFGGCKVLQEDLGAILNTATGEDPLSEKTVIAGLKEALRVGTGNTVLSVSTLDGYLGNQMIRIVVPEQLSSVASTMRQFGLGGQVDELEVGMNRAAELAAGEAREIFWNAITGMSIADAFSILKGHDTAATDYFRGRTEGALRSRFHPIVIDKMDEVGVSRLYGSISDTYNGLPLPGKTDMIDLDEYVTGRALDGLFTVLAGEEQKIRKDPAARTTELLRRVFKD